MKAWFIAILAGCFLILSACGSSPAWKATVEQEPMYDQKQPSLFAVKITDERDQIAEGLQVKAAFEMVKMDHGVMEIELQEDKAGGNKGSYSGQLHMAMEGQWQATIVMTDGNQMTEQTLTMEVNAASAAKAETAPSTDAVALINDQEVVVEDLDFYALINRIQIAMYRENDQKRYEGVQLEERMRYWDAQEETAKHRNTLLTQIIRLQAAALLAKEKGHQASDAEIAAEMEKIKTIYARSPAASQIIRQYGNDKFWRKQQSQYALIVLSTKAQNDVMELVKQANPKGQQKEWNVLAQKKWEEILISQIGSLDIRIVGATAAGGANGSISR